MHRESTIDPIFRIKSNKLCGRCIKKNVKLLYGGFAHERAINLSVNTECGLMCYMSTHMHEAKEWICSKGNKNWETHECKVRYSTQEMTHTTMAANCRCLPIKIHNDICRRDQERSRRADCLVDDGSVNELNLFWSHFVFRDYSRWQRNSGVQDTRITRTPKRGN